MLWTAPPRARERQGCGGTFEAPTIYEVDFDTRSRYRQVGLSRHSVERQAKWSYAGS